MTPKKVLERLGVKFCHAPKHGKKGGEIAYCLGLCKLCIFEVATGLRGHELYEFMEKTSEKNEIC